MDGVEFERIRYELPDPQVARVVLARPDNRNAQDKKMLYEIDHAFNMAATDPQVKVIILAADGPHFSSAHDLTDTTTGLDYEPVVQSAGHHEPGAAGMYAGEEEYRSWRPAPHPMPSAGWSWMRCRRGGSTCTLTTSLPST